MEKKTPFPKLLVQRVLVRGVERKSSVELKKLFLTWLVVMTDLKVRLQQCLEMTQDCFR